MRPSEIVQRERETILSLLSRHGLSNVRVFGSAARGEDRDGSDLDLLVDASPGTTLLTLVRAKNEIEERLRIPVDLLTEADLWDRFRHHALAEARPL